MNFSVKRLVKESREMGIKTKVLNFSFIIIEFILSIIVCTTFIISIKNYDALNKDLESFAYCNRSIINYNMETDRLEKYIKQYLVNKDTADLDEYIIELNHYRSTRGEYLELLKEEIKYQKPVIESFQKAFVASDVIIRDDLYAASLVWYATHKDTAKMSLQMQECFDEVKISNKDEALSDVNKISKAMHIVFSEDYIDKKAELKKYVDLTYQHLCAEAGLAQKNDEHNSKVFVYVFGISLFLLLFVFVAYIFCILFFVIVPINNQTKMIENGQKMDIKGGFESRYIAKAYNSLLEKNEVKASILKHKAEHDYLTGLINTAGFESIKKAFVDYEDSLAFLLIDVDFFKKINDTYGHEVGNDVLRKISKLLTEQFRNSDYVARVGGDEFAVLMTKIGDTPEQVILNKISNLNSILQKVDDSLPSISLSVGVSISKNGFAEEMVKQADLALYKVKKGGRCNCSFYEPQ